MRLELLNELWKARHPGGAIYRDSVQGRFKVSFGGHGKLYRYRGPTVEALARRLELVEDADIMEFSRQVVGGVAAGETEFDGPAGASDTIRWLLARCLLDGLYAVESTGMTKDVFGRATARYSVTRRVGPDPWTSTRGG